MQSFSLLLSFMSSALQLLSLRVERAKVVVLKIKKKSANYFTTVNVDNQDDHYNSFNNEDYDDNNDKK